MFAEDAARSLPYGRGFNDGFDLKLETELLETPELVLQALPAAHYAHSHLTDAFRSLIEYSVDDLLHGCAYFEIEYFTDEISPTLRPAAFKVHLLPADSVRKRRGRPIQIVPHATAEGKFRGDYFVGLDPDNLVKLVLPPSLTRAAAHTLRILQAAGSQTEIATDFFIGRHGNRTGFDFDTHRSRMNDLVLKDTREIGWTGRGLFAEELLDPGKAWRALKFARFQISIRNSVLSGLQEALDRAGRQIGFTAHLQLARVLTEDDVTEMEEALRNGTKPIAELMHPQHRIVPRD